MSYKQPPEKSKLVPPPNWDVPKETVPGQGQFDRRVRPAAKPAPADGYMNSGTDYKSFGC